MTDNITLNPGTGGKTVATDDVAGVHYQRVKVAIGPDGAAYDISSETPLWVRSRHEDVAFYGSVNQYLGVSMQGANLSVQTAEEDLWPIGGTYPFLSTAETVRIKAGGNVNDTAAGTGAQTCFVEGLDASGDAVTATLTTNGALASSASSSSFLRINRFYVLTVGTYGGANAGNVFLEGATSGTNIAIILANEGESQEAIYSIPRGSTFALTGISMQIDVTQAGSMRLYARDNFDITASAIAPKRVVHRVEYFTGSFEHQFRYYPTFTGKTDLWFAGVANAGTARMTARLEGVLRNNSLLV